LIPLTLPAAGSYDEWWPDLARKLNRKEWPDVPRYASASARAANYVALIAERRRRLRHADARRVGGGLRRPPGDVAPPVMFDGGTTYLTARLSGAVR